MDAGLHGLDGIAGWNCCGCYGTVGPHQRGARAMNVAKALTFAMAGAALLTLGAALTLGESPVAEGQPVAPGIDPAYPSTLPRAEGGRLLLDINRQTYNAVWPLVEDEATITCRPRRLATVITSSGEYALSGRALAAGYPSIWDSLLPIELRSDAALGPLVRAALALCPESESGEWPRETRKVEHARP